MTMIEFIKNTHHWSGRRKNNLKAIRILQVEFYGIILLSNKNNKDCLAAAIELIEVLYRS